jgi:hypothetical protein
MLREQRETEQQAQEIGEDDPLVGHVREKTPDAGSLLESGEQDLVAGDHDEAGERHPQRVRVEQRNADQRQRKQDEIDGYAKECRAFHGACRCSHRHFGKAATHGG